MGEGVTLCHLLYFSEGTMFVLTRNRYSTTWSPGVHVAVHVAVDRPQKDSDRPQKEQHLGALVQSKHADVIALGCATVGTD